jgi:hypothetical protein
MSIGMGGGTTGSVNQPTTGGPQKGIVSTTPLPGGNKEGVKRTGGRRKRFIRRSCKRCKECG